MPIEDERDGAYSIFAINRLVDSYGLCDCIINEIDPYCIEDEELSDLWVQAQDTLIQINEILGRK